MKRQVSEWRSRRVDEGWNGWVAGWLAGCVNKWEEEKVFRDLVRGEHLDRWGGCQLGQ